MRLKLEEEYTQNTKNHEEEVQLRLKFEAKLNEMHGACRDLTTKLNRSERDLGEAKEKIQAMTDDYQSKIEENTTLN